ncbi:hypothetical protein A1O3_02774 [Capronia epimyces CBS 606.96]|uniref:Fe2OG dioxygenase domain-containing protein n=1 Tax=Capronia epimyces CBS 606.96 TaxID=1182542 RepID=W9YA18_9EURO|nr:uncharacterized protein A1O3_02774 [Capronia epimyces CBS 606.96]EXJ89707.1 hypothetical protein A1O3_02774 [Capronia epimyces CBS 606.96]
MWYKGQKIAVWGDQNKANGHFGAEEKSRSAIAGKFEDIPIIDISGIHSSDINERMRVAGQIRDACVRVGFFYAKGHGVPQDIIDKTFEWAEQFFALPFEDKMELFINNQGNYRGYTPLYGSGKPDVDGLANANEAFDWGLDSKLNDDAGYDCMDPFMQGHNVWPRQLPGFEDHLSAYFGALRSLGRVLARNIALSLGLPEDLFDDYLTHPGCSAVVAHYPPLESGSTKLGLDPHTDNEFLTLLAPGKVRALEVLNRDGQWISAPPIDGTFIVNVGDQLQRLTNNLYISTKHRVINHTGEERISVPFFFSANWEAVIDPLPELVGKDTKIESNNVTAGQMYKHTMLALHMPADANPTFKKYLKA